MSKNNKKPKEKMGFSNRGWIINLIIVITITIVAIVHSFVSGRIAGDSTVYVYLIPASWAELGVYSGFMLKKSEKENTKGGIKYDLAMKNKDNSSEVETMGNYNFDSRYDGVGDSSFEDASNI